MKFSRRGISKSSVGILTAFLLGPGSAQAQNLIQNPRFSTSLAGWTPDPLSSDPPAWNVLDAYAEAASGSARLLVQPSGVYRFAILRQCVSVSPSVAYDFGGSVFRAAGSAPVQLFLSFHSDPGCPGSFGADVNVTIAESRGGWEVFGTTVTMPVGVVSVSVSLFAANFTANQLNDAFLDNVYLRAATSPPSGVRFHTISPCRVVDTRSPDPFLQGPRLKALADRPFVIAGRCGVPVSARAVAVNVTATEAQDGGNLRLYVRDSPFPLFSTINYGPAQTRANSAVANLGFEGEIVVRSDQPTGTVHVILDVNGYFE
jgi:hypothetical protein